MSAATSSKTSNALWFDRAVFYLDRTRIRVAKWGSFFKMELFPKITVRSPESTLVCRSQLFPYPSFEILQSWTEVICPETSVML